VSSLKGTARAAAPTRTGAASRTARALPSAAHPKCARRCQGPGA
jgi:hypothetical protein